MYFSVACPPWVYRCVPCIESPFSSQIVMALGSTAASAPSISGMWAAMTDSQSQVFTMQIWICNDEEHRSEAPCGVRFDMGSKIHRI